MCRKDSSGFDAATSRLFEKSTLVAVADLEANLVCVKSVTGSGRRVIAELVENRDVSALQECATEFHIQEIIIVLAIHGDAGCRSGVFCDFVAAVQIQVKKFQQALIKIAAEAGVFRGLILKIGRSHASLRGQREFRHFKRLILDCSVKNRADQIALAAA